MTGDAYIMRLNNQGDSLWMNRYGSPYNETPYSIIQSPDGGFVCAGWTYNTINPNYSDAWIFKTDSLGNLLWQKQFDGYGNNEFIEGLVVNEDSTIVVGGETLITDTTSKAYLIKLQPNGDTLWTKQFGGAEGTAIFGMSKTSNNGYAVAGAIMINGKQRAYVAKLDAFGEVEWEGNYAKGPENWSFSAVHELPNGNFMAAGIDFDYSQPGSRRIRMMEFNALGDSIWSKAYRHTTGGDKDYMFDMKLTSDGGFIICGYVIHTSPTKNDALVIKIDSNRCDNIPCQLTIGVEEEKKFDVDFLIYPNPTTGIIHIELKEKTTSDLTITIYNLFGEKVYNTKVIQNDININRLDNGLYFIQLTDKNNKQLFTQKLLLQK
jgi:hypothetical protein